MPLLLTTPKSTGDLDSTASSYGEVKIIRFTHNSLNGTIQLRCQFGNTVDGAWVPGILRTTDHVIVDKPAQLDHEGNEVVAAKPDYTTMVTQLPAEGETIYVAAARELYEWLIAEGIFVGTYTP